MGQSAGIAAGGTLACCICSWSAGVKPLLCSTLRKLITVIGPKALAGSVTEVGRVHFSLAGKAMFSISDLKVHNLDPFLSDYLLCLGHVRVIFNLGKALRTKFKEIEINEVYVENCKLQSETGLTADSNVKALMRKLKENDQKDQGAEAKKTEAEKQSEDKKEKKVELHQLHINGVEVRMTTTMQEKSHAPSAWIKLPPIKVENFSQRFGKVKPAKLVSAVLELILGSMISSIGNLGMKIPGGDGGGSCVIA